MITIKNSTVEGLIRKLAARDGVDLTKAVERAVSYELARGPEERARKLALMNAAADRIAALPILDNRSDEELLDYDEYGLPQ